MPLNQDSQDPIAIEEVAAERGRRLLGDRDVDEETAGLRISVQQGGCKELSYKLDFADEPAIDDIVTEDFGFRVFIDPHSLEYIEGSVLTYKDELQNTGFDIQNPNAVSECGCGSFSVNK
jgi:iron-sulfur cluster assembly protein